MDVGDGNERVLVFGSSKGYQIYLVIGNRQLNGDRLQIDWLECMMWSIILVDRHEYIPNSDAIFIR